MTLIFYALWMVCALGAVVFAAAASRHVRELVAVAAGFVVAVAGASRAGLPDATLVSALAAGAAAVYLFRPRWAVLSAACGGALAGTLGALVEVQGLPWPAAIIAAAALVAVPVWLARTRPHFAPDVLVEDGMLAIGVLALAVAVLPGVLDGWHAATNLAAVPDRDIPAAVPVWTMAALLMSTSLGAVYSLWSRR